MSVLSRTRSHQPVKLASQGSRVGIPNLTLLVWKERISRKGREMEMLVKHAEGPMKVVGRTPTEAAKKLIGMGITEATLIEAKHPHTGRVLRIRAGKIRIIR